MLTIPIKIVNIKQVLSYYGEILFHLDDISSQEKESLLALLTRAINSNTVEGRDRTRVEQMIPDIQLAILKDKLAPILPYLPQETAQMAPIKRIEDYLDHHPSHPISTDLKHHLERYIEYAVAIHRSPIRYKEIVSSLKTE